MADLVSMPLQGDALWLVPTAGGQTSNPVADSSSGGAAAVHGAAPLPRAVEPAASPLIDLSGVSYTYDGEVSAVLAGVSLTVRPGEFVLILGPSGCGKSTLLHMMNGSVPHILNGKLEGDAVICGKPVATTTVAQFATEVGMVFQDPDSQIINTRVRDEVCFGLENLCRPPQEILARQAEALDQVGMAAFGDRSIFELSGGQKQRVSVAAVLASHPRLLILDEPTANLDPAGMAEVFAVLARLNRDFGTTIVMVEHRVDELADKVSRVVMMDRGTIVFDGPPREAFSSRRVMHSEEAEIIPTASWFPQASEFAIELAAVSGEALDPASLPLSADEAVGFCCGRRFAAERSGASPSSAATATATPHHPTVPLLSIAGLNFGYDRDAPILKAIDLDLSSNAIVALLGQNGSGKTTLARMLVGINQAPAGTIHLEGKDLSLLSAREIASYVGYVFQNPDHQFVTDRVDEEIAYGLQVRDYAPDVITTRVDDILDVVDLKRYRDRSPFSLSLGERRRLSVATMLVLEPRLLVLDEPTIGQDHERAEQLMGLMQRLRERYGTTILMITHDVRLVAEWADRALALVNGEIAFDGTPLELFNRADVLQAAGLLPPPIHAISRQLAARNPDSGLGPVLSVPDLVSALMATAGSALA
ncbi:MAG: energy-coupling factor transporter ATPase [Ancalomicrobiaceae bacterium]|nr:energy-coupling factor transporter ATPase [Ancalomicrobiaceae bacterium]